MRSAATFDASAPDPLTAGTTRREAERALVAGLLMGRRDVFDAAASLVAPADFATGRCRRAYEWVAAQHAAGRRIPPMDLVAGVVAEWGEPGYTGILGAWSHALRVKVHAARHELRLAADGVARNPGDEHALGRLDRARADIDDLEAFHAELCEESRRRTAAWIEQSRGSAADGLPDPHRAAPQLAAA